MIKGLFVAGTGTGVGKSCLSVFFLSVLKLSKGKTLYYKPIQCGRPSDVAFIKKNAKHKYAECSYNLKTPSSPHFAFAKEKVKFSKKTIRDFLSKAERQYDFIIMEAAGGVRVPITENFDMADLAKLSGFPVLLVAQPGLGTINHTLLSIDYLKAKKLKIYGFIFYLANNENTEDEMIADNAKIIEKISKIEFLGAVQAQKIHLSPKNPV